MDRKSIIILAACFIAYFSLQWLINNKIYPPKPAPALTNSVAALETNQAAFSTNLPQMSAAPAVSNPAVRDVSLPEQLVEITNAYAHYTFSSYGGGLKEVELLQYPEMVSTTRQHRSQTNRVATLNTFTPEPTLAILGGSAVQGDGIFKLTQTATGLRAEKQLTNGLSLVKDFDLSSNYLVKASVRLENRSDNPLQLPPMRWFAGTATPMSPRDDGSAVGVTWYNGSKSQEVGASFFSTKGFACMPRVPPAEYRGGQTNIEWVALHNQFFALIVMPPQTDPASQVVVRTNPLPKPSEEELTYRSVREPVGYTAELVYPGRTLAPHQAITDQVMIFAGPKEYRTLATIAAVLNNNVDAVMGYGGFFGFFSKALLLGMNALHQTLKLPYGWAIIVITVIIKVVFWPLTQASTRSAKRMQMLQPQIKALQEKYKDDPVKAQRKMMEFWKEHKINPMSGCLPTLIQMPVFFGFFFMIRSAIELRGAPFLWVGDLSSPDTLFIIPGINFPFNLLPLVMGATMLWQAHLTPPSPGMDQAQAKLMRYMPLMFLVFLYNYSAGLTLYWTVQNLLSIVQTKLIRTTADPAPAAKGPVLTAPQKKRK
ncbi:MAG TPA: membrane protein insertase YidC [Verrucomicrobiae bacterium]|nr:membrane protein insertase YidC [Verrucomicrobiae bacterium]